GECARDLELDLASPPRAFRIVIPHLPRGPEQHFLREANRDTTSTRERAYRERFAVQCRFLLPGWRVDDAASCLVASRFGIPCQPNCALQRALGLWCPRFERAFSRQQRLGDLNRLVAPEMQALIPAVTGTGRRRDDVTAVSAPIEPGSDAAPTLTIGVPQTSLGPGEIQMNPA